MAILRKKIERTNFAHTGFFSNTMTTVDDPLLEVYKRDNKILFTIRVNDHEIKVIDKITIELYDPEEIDSNVLELTVYDLETNQLLGTVKELLSAKPNSSIGDYFSHESFIHDILGK